MHAYLQGPTGLCMYMVGPETECGAPYSASSHQEAPTEVILTDVEALPYRPVLDAPADEEGLQRAADEAEARLVREERHDDLFPQQTFGGEPQPSVDPAWAEMVRVLEEPRAVVGIGPWPVLKTPDVSEVGNEMLDKAVERLRALGEHFTVYAWWQSPAHYVLMLTWGDWNSWNVEQIRGAVYGA